MRCCIRPIVFSIVFSQAMISAPEKKNEVSGLMIMGLFVLMTYFVWFNK